MDIFFLTHSFILLFMTQYIEIKWYPYVLRQELNTEKNLKLFYVSNK